MKPNLPQLYKSILHFFAALINLASAKLQALSVAKSKAVIGEK